mgnify:FL=1|jgi:hypothetical protein|tara:strand:+ start:6404 stop:6997 length:594 start_codon:yes stop_codon:yes gene_type:complete
MSNSFKILIVLTLAVLFAGTAEAQPGAPGQAGQAGSIQNDGQIEGGAQTTGFIGGSDTGNPRSFSTTVGSGFGNSMGGFGGMGGMGGMGGFGGMGGMGGFGNQNQNQPQNTLRFPYVIAFKTTPFLPQRVQVRAESRLKKLPGLSKFNQVSVTMNKTTATLKGVVVSDRDKRFIEKLVMLEPGVKEIDNQLAIKAVE